MFWLLLIALATARAQSAQLDKWELTGTLGVLPPVSPDQSPVVAEIRARLAERQLSEAGRLAELLVSQEPERPEGYFWAGFVALHQKRFHQAVRRLRQAEKRVPGGNVVQKTLALAYLLLGQNVLFEIKIREAIALDGQDFAPYYLQGRFMQSEERNVRRAIESYRRALELRPGHYESLHYLGLTLATMGEPEEAEQYFQEAIAAAKLAGQTFSLPHNQLSRLARGSDPQAALEYAAQAVASEPNLADNHLQLAKAYMALGRLQEAVAALKTSVSLDANQSSPYYSLATLYRRLGDGAAAERALSEFQSRISCYGRE
jgi:tetratricopeptide (TPR) repeat protein